MTLLQNVDLMAATVTPFDDEGDIDHGRLEYLTSYLIEHGSSGFVIGGTTGETPELTHDEKTELYQHSGEVVNARVPVIAGTGNGNTKETVVLTNEVVQINGIDYALVVVPPYNKPNQWGMVAHFIAVVDNADLPIITYNVPGRTGVKMAQEIVAELLHRQNIAAVKQCTSLEEFEYIVEHRDPDFAVFTGENAQALTARVLGVNGVILVTSHTYVDQMCQMYGLLHRGDYQTAGELQRWLTSQIAALSIFPSPSPVKAVLNAQGFNVGSCHLSILLLNKEEKCELEIALLLLTNLLTARNLPLNLGE